jgi:predicted HTH transcriptional regulator
MKKKIDVRGVDLEVWEQFKALVVSKHGKLSKVMGKAVTEALKLYIEKYGGAGGSPPPGEQGERTHTSQRISKIERDVENIKTYLLSMIEPGGSLSRKSLENIIMNLSNVYDKRSIQARIKALVADGFLKPEGHNGSSIYRLTVPSINS